MKTPKNYLCINGKKIELTKEQLEQLGVLKEPIATLSADGKIAKIGEYEFIVLKKDKDTVELLLKNSLCERNFDDDTKNFSESDIREYLDDFADILSNIIGEDNIVKHTVDLTTLDGLKDYGSCECRVSLLTSKQYAENVYIIDEFKLDKWWWLANAWSNEKHGWEYSVCCVSPLGDIDNGLYYFNIIGVRPFCILKSNIFVSE